MSQTASILRLVKCHYCKKHVPYKDAEILASRIDPKDFHPICWFICKNCKEKYKEKLYELEYN